MQPLLYWLSVLCACFYLVSAYGYSNYPYYNDYNNYNHIYRPTEYYYPWLTVRYPNSYGYNRGSGYARDSYYRPYGSYDNYHSRRYLQSGDVPATYASGNNIHGGVREFSLRNPLSNLGTLPSLTSVLSDLREASRIMTLVRLKLEPYYRILNRIVPVTSDVHTPLLRSLSEGPRTMRKAGVLGFDGAVEDFVQRNPVDQSKLEGIAALIRVFDMADKLSASIEAARLTYSSGYSSAIKDSTDDLIQRSVNVINKPRDLGNWAAAASTVKQLKESVALLQRSFVLKDHQFKLATNFIEDGDKFLQNLGDQPVELDETSLIEAEKSLLKIAEDALKLDGLILKPRVSFNGLELTDMMKLPEKDSLKLHIKTQDIKSKFATLESLPLVKAVPSSPVELPPADLTFNLDELTKVIQDDIGTVRVLFATLEGMMRRVLPSVSPNEFDNPVQPFYTVKISHLESAMDVIDGLADPLMEMEIHCRVGCNGWKGIGFKLNEEYPNVFKIQSYPPRELETETSDKAADVKNSTMSLPDSVPLDAALMIYGITLQDAFDDMVSLPTSCNGQKIELQVQLLGNDPSKVLEDSNLEAIEIEKILDPKLGDEMNKPEIEKEPVDPICKQKQLAIPVFEQVLGFIRDVGAASVELAQASSIDDIQAIQSKLSSILVVN